MVARSGGQGGLAARSGGQGGLAARSGGQGGLVARSGHYLLYVSFSYPRVKKSSPRGFCHYVITAPVQTFSYLVTAKMSLLKTALVPRNLGFPTSLFVVFTTQKPASSSKAHTQELHSIFPFTVLWLTITEIMVMARPPHHFLGKTSMRN